MTRYYRFSSAVHTAVVGLLMVVVMGCQNHGYNGTMQKSVMDKWLDSVRNVKAQNSTGKEILRELQIIRGLQEASHKEHEDAKKKRLESDGQMPVGGEYDAVLQIADNTQTSWSLDGWNLFGILTFVVALISCIYTFVTYRAQKQTERHTTKAPAVVQLSKLRDLPRHFYRNLVCTSAIIHVYRVDSEGGSKRTYYPSESHLYKLQTLPDDIVLPIDIIETDNDESNPYHDMHELKVLLRNYCTEITVASQHLARQNIKRESLLQDFDNLLYKPLFLVTASLDYRAAVEQQQTGQKTWMPKIRNRIFKTNAHEKQPVIKTSFVFEALKNIMGEHLKKLSKKANFDCLFEPSASAFLNIIAENGYDNYIDMNTPKSVDRSINELLTYGIKKEITSEPGIVYSEPTVKAVLKRQTLIDNLDSNEKIFCQKLIGIKNSNDFVQFCANHQFGQNVDDIQLKNSLYQQLALYLNFLQQLQWDVHTLLKTILVVDTAIETTRIGRVNF